MNVPEKTQPFSWASSLSFLLALETCRRGNVGTRHRTCIFWCMKPFPRLSSVLQLKETRLFIIRPFTFSQPYLLPRLPPYNELFSSWPHKHSVQLQTLCRGRLFFLPRRHFSTWLHQSPTHPLAQIDPSCEPEVHLHQPSDVLLHLYSHTTLFSSF